MIRGKFWKSFFNTMPHIRHMTSFVYVILLISGNCITWMLFQALRNVSRWRCSLKLLNMTNKTFWKYPRSQHILLLWLLLLINHCYKHLDWFFRKSWSWLKLLNMIRETYWKNHFYIPCPNFNVLRHLLVFTNFSTKLSF